MSRQVDEAISSTCDAALEAVARLAVLTAKKKGTDLKTAWDTALAAEERDSDLFQFCPQYGFVEFGPPDDEGLREVIGTSFHNLVMPLIRYRTGDYVRVSDSGVVCEIAGRGQEFLLSATGRRISLTAFNMHDAVFDNLYAVQFYQEAPGEVEFRYIASPQFSRTRLEGMEKRIRQKLGNDFRIELRAVKEVEKTARGKRRWLVSKLQ